MAAPPKVEPSKKNDIMMEDKGNESDASSVTTAINIRTNGAGPVPDALRQR